METTNQVTPPEKRNPTGKGGFGDNPQNRSDGGWKKENTISYQYKRFLNMTPEEIDQWALTLKKDRTVAMDIAYKRIVAAKSSLPDVKEITDRTEGKAQQAVDVTSGGEKLSTLLVEFVGEDNGTDNAEITDEDTTTSAV